MNLHAYHVHLFVHETNTSVVIKKISHFNKVATPAQNCRCVDLQLPYSTKCWQWKTLFIADKIGEKNYQLHIPHK